MQQDATAAALQAMKPQFPEQKHHLKCPRCGSTNTKFCYYNNYNLSQPRHLCKNCRRYWTKGGALDNIPVGGGGRRKNSKRSSSNDTKRSNSSAASSSSTTTSLLQLPRVQFFSSMYPPAADMDGQMLANAGSFRSMLESSRNYGYPLDSFDSVGSGVLGLPNSAGTMGDSALEMSSSGNGNQSGGNLPPPPENMLGVKQGESCCYNGANGWPDLSLYLPCSSFQ